MKANREAARDWQSLNNALRAEKDIVDRINLLRTELNRYEFHSACALFGEQTWPFVTAFQKNADTYYGTGNIQNLDFKHNAETARKTINAWGAKQTHDNLHWESKTLAQKIMEICRTTDKQLAMVFALARWGGLRIGETLLLRWEHVDFETGRLTVLSPKTANKGKDKRVLPLFPELRRALLDLPDKDKASLHDPLVPRYAGKTTQWAGKALKAMITRAGLKPWKRLWQNVRATRTTELADKFPGHLCNEWLGHTEDVAAASYRRATDDHYRSATRFETASTVPASEQPPESPTPGPELRLVA